MCKLSHSFLMCKLRLLRSAAQNSEGGGSACEAPVGETGPGVCCARPVLPFRMKSQQSRLAPQCSGGGAASPGPLEGDGDTLCLGRDGACVVNLSELRKMST